MNKFLQKIFPKRFGSYWKKIRNNPNFDDEIRFISDNFLNSESYKYVSNMWHIINISHYKFLLDKGLERYGSDIGKSYFTFTDYNEENIKNLLSNYNISKIKKNNCDFKIHNGFSLNQSISYNYLCLLLYENLKLNKYFKFLSYLKDKTYIGFDDPYIEIDNINITTDKIISLFDFEKINKFKKLESNNKILELGAGSGRLTECILSLKDNINYTVCDIPPSIYISYKRLKLAFPNKKISLLIDQNDNDKLNTEIKNNDISFIFPHQLQKINSNYYDLAIAVDCLHEMDKKTIKLYFSFITHITNNFYFSIWSQTKNWHSGRLFKRTEKLIFENGDYPIPSLWKNVFKENMIFPSNQLGLGYITKKNIL